jgi:hypothetical protein
MKVDQERRHRVEQSVTVWPRSEREPRQKPAVLDGKVQILGGQDRVVAARPRRQADGLDRWQARDLEEAQDLELGRGDADGLFLERDRPVVGDEEPNEVSRRADRQLAEGQRRRPLGERQLPGQIEERRAAATQSEARMARAGGVRQRFFRRYAVTVAS